MVFSDSNSTSREEAPNRHFYCKIIRVLGPPGGLKRRFRSPLVPGGVGKSSPALGIRFAALGGWETTFWAENAPFWGATPPPLISHDFSLIFPLMGSCCPGAVLVAEYHP